MMPSQGNPVISHGGEPNFNNNTILYARKLPSPDGWVSDQSGNWYHTDSLLPISKRLAWWNKVQSEMAGMNGDFTHNYREMFGIGGINVYGNTIFVTSSTGKLRMFDTELGTMDSQYIQTLAATHTPLTIVNGVAMNVPGGSKFANAGTLQSYGQFLELFTPFGMY